MPTLTSSAPLAAARSHHRAPPDDRALVDAFLTSGSDDAFRALYRRHSPRLRAIALRRAGGDPAVADEVLQDTWISAVEALATFRWASSLSTWLTGIAINHLRGRWRRAARAPAAVADLETIADPSTPPAGEHADLQRAVARLPDGYRRVLVLHGVYGYTHAEIGRLLDISEGTSKSQLSRARNTLRRMLAGTDSRRTLTPA